MIPEALIAELVRAEPKVRLKALLRIEEERGSSYAAQATNAVAERLRELRKP